MIGIDLVFRKLFFVNSREPLPESLQFVQGILTFKKLKIWQKRHWFIGLYT